MTAAELAEKLEDIAGYRDIVLKHRKITDDKKITYVLKDGTRIHEDESVIAKLAASLTAALESAAETATEAAARLRSMEEALSAIANHPTGGVGCNPEEFVAAAKAALGGA